MRDSIRSECIPGTGNKVVFILGWGNRLEDACILWLITKAREENWDLLIIEIPTEFSFQNVLSKIKDIIDEGEIDLLIGFSMGAIFANYIEAQKRIFISPYWNIPKRRLILRSYKFSRFLTKLLKFIELPVCPRGFCEKDLGEIDIPKSIPKRISLKTTYEIFVAQENLPELQRNSDYLFFCSDDKIIGLLPRWNWNKKIEFFGGHCLFSVCDRNMLFTKIMEIIKKG